MAFVDTDTPVCPECDEKINPDLIEALEEAEQFTCSSCDERLVICDGEIMTGEAFEAQFEAEDEEDY